jgi:nucleoside-diphosphate-sugar epimerase
VSRVLLTGAAGFIGTHTLAPLLAAGHEVHAISRNPPQACGSPTHPDGGRLVWHAADLTDPLRVPTLVSEIAADSLLHLAWYVQHGSYWNSAENVVWAEATLRLLRAFQQAGGRRAVLAGTCAEYEWSRAVYQESSAPLFPATLYGAAKHATHILSESFARSAGLELAWGRIFMPYGPGERGARLVPSVVQALLGGREAPLSDGTQVRDFMFVEDVARAFSAILDSTVEGAVNVASGRPCTLERMIGAFAAETGRPELLRWGALPARTGEPKELVADVRRLREEVGFVPQVRLADGVRRTLWWWRERSAMAA